MNQDLIFGLLALGVPLFAIGFLMLRRNKGVFRMFVAMLLIGLGYLTATGALTDIGRSLQNLGATGKPAEAPPAAPAAETPAPAAATPAPAPAEDASGEPPPEEPAAATGDAPPSEGEPAPPAPAPAAAPTPAPASP